MTGQEHNLLDLLVGIDSIIQCTISKFHIVYRFSKEHDPELIIDHLDSINMTFTEINDLIIINR